MSLYLTIPLLTAAALIQGVWFSRMDVWGARPNLMLLIVMLWAMLRGMDEGLVWGFIGGLLLDLLSGGPLGGTSLALMAAAFLTGQRWGQALGTQVVRLLFVVLVAVLVYHLIVLTALVWTGHTVMWSLSLLRVALPSALLNAILAPFLQPFLAWLERKTRRESLTL